MTLAAARRRIRIDLAYDGTDFHGWQSQLGGRTVQDVLERTLGRLHGRASITVRAAGRTDAGAHARGQVVDAVVHTRLDDGALAHALGRLLPADIRPLAVRTVAEAFHARRDALSKTYRYRLDRSPAGDPFLSRYALHYPHALDTAVLRECLALLVGRRDWSGFTDSACTVRDRRRHLVAARFDELSATEAWFSFTADGFLTRMARNLVGTLLEVGAEGAAAGGAARIARILERADRTLAGPAAPARGLVLEHVAYGD
jgi:tRNA pseudouridine38-40 synthase